MKIINFLFVLTIVISCDRKTQQQFTKTETQQLSGTVINDQDANEMVVNNCIQVDSLISDKLFAFVGTQINLTNLPYEPGDFDSKFCTEYLVVQNIYGDYPNDTIRFMAYDHYGWPYFSQFENVLLFVSSHQGALYHQKYQFFDVYKTNDEKWATIGDPYKFEPDVHRKGIKAIPLEFGKEVKFFCDTLSNEEFAKLYPQPYFKINDNTAIPVLGTPVEQLFEIKKQGVLKARGIF